MSTSIAVWKAPMVLNLIGTTFACNENSPRGSTCGCGKARQRLKRIVQAHGMVLHNIELGTDKAEARSKMFRKTWAEVESIHRSSARMQPSTVFGRAAFMALSKCTTSPE